MKHHTFSFLAEAAQRWSDDIAVIEADRKISFFELFNAANAIAASLSTLSGLDGKGIGLMCGNSSHFVSALFGCSATGAVVMPVLPGTKPAEIENLFKESGIRFLLAQKKSMLNFSSSIEQRNIGYDFVLYIFKDIIPLEITSIFPGAAFIRPSSGTTGKSKGVVISHQAVFERTQAANDGLKLDHQSRILWVMPMAFHFVVSILLYVRYGACIIINDDFTAASMIGNANRNQATLLYASPLHYRLLAAEDGDKKFLTLKTAVSTSAGLEPSVSAAFFEKYGLPVSQAYGIIEIGLPFLNTSASPKRSGSIGCALPQYRAAILDENLNELPRGEQGAFAVSGPGMFSGYLWPVKQGKEILSGPWFLTGDIAAMDQDGYVFIKGRSKSMINVSGNKVFPEEVEAVLKMHEGVDEVRVYGGMHPVTGELVQAEIILHPGYLIQAEDLISMCREHLAPYQVPQRIFFVNDIAKTGTGKVSRKKIS